MKFLAIKRMRMLGGTCRNCVCVCLIQRPETDDLVKFGCRYEKEQMIGPFCMENVCNVDNNVTKP